METTKAAEQKKAEVVKNLRERRGDVVEGQFFDFVHFLVDYDIIPFTVSFIIAGSANNLITSITRTFIRRRIPYLNEILINFIVFITTIILMFMFIYFVFVPIVTSKQIMEETKLKAVIDAAEQKKIEKKADEIVHRSELFSMP